MGNLKLGLLISSTDSLGYHPHQWTINEGDWEHSCVDMRTTINELGIFGTTIICVTFHGKNGYLIAVINSYNTNDNTTAYIHVPAKVNISGEELNKNYIEEVKKVICSKDPQPDITNLETQFSKSISEKDVESPEIANITSKEQGPIAYRMYCLNKDSKNITLDKLFNNLAQPGYNNYRGVFFIDEKFGIKVKKGNAIDLTSSELLSTKIIDIPKNVDGFEPNQSGKFEGLDGNMLSITWSKTGYAPIKENYTFGQESTPRISMDKRKILFDSSKVKAYDGANHKEIINPVIRIYDNKELCRNKEIPETSFNSDNVYVLVEAEGYKSKKEKITKEKALAGKKTIYMEEEKCEYTYRVPASDDMKRCGGEEYITFKYVTKKGETNVSPLPGYSISWGSSESTEITLERTPKKTKRKFLIVLSTTIIEFIIIIGLVIWIIIGLENERFGSHVSVENKEQTETMNNGSSTLKDDCSRLESQTQSPDSSEIMPAAMPPNDQQTENDSPNTNTVNDSKGNKGSETSVSGSSINKGNKLNNDNGGKRTKLH